MALLSGRKAAHWLDRFPWKLLRLGRSGSGRAFGVLSVWVWWERFTNWRFKVRPVGPDSFLLYSLSHYSGKERTLADGTTLRSGDPIIELHFNNAFVTRLISENQFTPWKGIRLAARDVGVLEQWVVDGDLGEVRAFHAISLFASTGQRLGFEIRRMPRSPYWGLVRYFMIGLIAVHHPEGWKHASRMRDTMWPVEMWLGVETMRRRVSEEKARGEQVKKRVSASSSASDEQRPN